MLLSRRLTPRTFLAALALGLILRVAALPLPGTEDVNVWKVWSYNGAKDVAALYGVGGDPPVRGLLKYGKTYTTVDYPPVALYELSLAGLVYRAIFPAYPNTWPLVAALKLPGLLAGAALTWLIFVCVRRELTAAARALPATALPAQTVLAHTPSAQTPPLTLVSATARPAAADEGPSSPDAARAGAGSGADATVDAGAEAKLLAIAQLAALGYWLNPAMILNAEVLGYLDPLVMLPAIAAFVLLAWGRPAASGACVAIALLTKPQALLIVPAWLFAIAPWGAAAWRPAIARALRACAGGTAAALAAILPFALAGALPNMWLAFGSFYARRDILSGNAANVWWIANYLSRAVHGVADLGWQAFFVPVARVMAVSTFMEQGLPDPRPFGQAAILAVCAWAFWRMRRQRDLSGVLMLAAFTVHAVFVLGVGVHEHHQVLMVPLLAIAAALRPRLRVLYAAVTTICALNMYLFYGLGRGWPPMLPRGLTGLDATVLLSLANVLALAWHARRLAAEAAASPPAPALAVRERPAGRLLSVKGSS